MYGAITRNKTLVAVHKKERIVRKFISQQKEKELKIIKFKNNLLVQNNDLENLYLVRCEDMYVPCELYNVYSELEEQTNYDLQYSIDILERVKIIDNLSKKEIKSIDKTIDILKSQMKSNTPIDIDTLKTMKEFKNDYNLAILKE